MKAHDQLDLLGAKAQTALILEYLRSGRCLTPMEALEKFRCFRLAARIKDLRNDGHHIETRIVKSGSKHWAEYRLGITPIQQSLSL